MRKKTETILALEHAKRVCEQLPEGVARLDVRRLVVKAYRAGYRKRGNDRLYPSPLDITDSAPLPKVPEGLLQKYNISKANGNPVSHEAEYFVLRLDSNDSDKLHVWACRKALVAYANELHHNKHLTQLADDLMNCWGWETVARQLMTETRAYCGVPYSEPNIMLFITPLTEAVKDFYGRMSSYRINDTMLRDLAFHCLRDYQGHWYSETPEFKKLGDVLKDYSELIK